MITKLTTAKLAKLLTIIVAALVAFTGGLAMLPIDSANLPMPPEWRPYLAGVAFLTAGVRIIVVPTLTAVIDALKSET